MRVAGIQFAIYFLLSASSWAQGAGLPSNYKTIFENADVLVQQVHYGPHETVSMHDHPAVTTVYVYLDDDKGFDILHEGTDKPVHRPPARAGAFRVSPGNLERHSIVNNSGVASDFVRIELKNIPVHTLHEEFRGRAATPPLTPGVSKVYEIPQLRVERVICGDTNTQCKMPAAEAPSVVVQIPPSSMAKRLPILETWYPAGTPVIAKSPWPNAQFLRVVLLQP